MLSQSYARTEGSDRIVTETFGQGMPHVKVTLQRSGSIDLHGNWTTMSVLESDGVEIPTVRAEYRRQISYY